MSLFGGEIDPESSDHSSLHSPNTGIIEDTDILPAVQRNEIFPPKTTTHVVDQLAAATRHTDIEDVHFDSEQGLSGSDDGGEIEDESEEELTRPNHFPGDSSTWKGHTVAERELAASLEQIESGDLSAHLYNAHALKKRVRRSPEQLTGIRDWRRRDAWLKRGEELNTVTPLGVMQRELVPERSWTAWPLGNGNVPRPDEDFGRKKTVDDEEGWTIGCLGENERGEELREELQGVLLRIAKSSWRSRDNNVDNDTHSSEGSSKLKTDPRNKRSPSRLSHSGTSDNDSYTSQGSNTHDEEEQSKAHIKSDSPGSMGVSILTDDEKARRNLLPPINSVLAQLDSFSLAVRRTRINHFSTRRPSRSRSASRISSGLEDDFSETRTKINRGRKGPGPPNLETDRDVGLEENGEDGDATDALQDGHGRRTSQDYRRSDSNRERSNTTGLLDWSEILGIASMIGWDEKAVSRTAQRCASVFDESMTFRTFEEDLSKMTPTVSVNSINRTTLPSLSQNSGLGQPPRAEKRPPFAAWSRRCPHTDCWGHDKEFQFPYRVVEHIKRIHGYDPRTNNPDNEDRKHGGVHVDGYLEQIVPKRNWIRRQRSKSGSRMKKAKNGGDEKE